MSLINDALKVAGGKQQHTDRPVNDIKPLTPTRANKNGAWTPLSILGVLALIALIGFLMVKINQSPTTTTATLPPVEHDVEESGSINGGEKPVPVENDIPATSFPEEPPPSGTPGPELITAPPPPPPPQLIQASTTKVENPPPTVEEVEENYRVTVIVVSGNTRSAVVNTHLVGIGDYLPGGVKVTDIQPRFVQITVRGKDYFLTSQTP